MTEQELIQAWDRYLIREKVQKVPLDEQEILIDQGISHLKKGDRKQAKHFFELALKKVNSAPQGLIDGIRESCTRGE